MSAEFPSHVCRVDVQELVRELRGIDHEHLAPELPAPLPGRPPHREPRDQRPHDGNPHHAQGERSEEQRGPVPEFEYLGLTVGPTDASHPSMRSVSFEQELLGRCQLDVAFSRHVIPRPRRRATIPQCG